MLSHERSAILDSIDSPAGRTGGKVELDLLRLSATETQSVLVPWKKDRGVGIGEAMA